MGCYSHQLIPPKFRTEHFTNEIHTLIRFNQIVVAGSVPQCSYNDFGSQLQHLQQL
jgi:hypothetical protein